MRIAAGESFAQQDASPAELAKDLASSKPDDGGDADHNRSRGVREKIALSAIIAWPTFGAIQPTGIK
jgi:hypothetical protein